jgi:hypothetical protein
MTKSIVSSGPSSSGERSDASSSTTLVAVRTSPLTLVNDSLQFAKDRWLALKRPAPLPDPLRSQDQDPIVPTAATRSLHPSFHVKGESSFSLTNGDHQSARVADGAFFLICPTAPSETTNV